VSKVAVIPTSSKTVLEDYTKALDIIDYTSFMDKQIDTIIKINLSWSLFYPACSTPPWQLEGVLHKLRNDGFDPSKIIPVENQTVVTHPWKGAYLNKWLPILKKYETEYRPLTNEKWVNYNPKGDVPWMRELFKEKIIVPEVYLNSNIVHLPTVKCVHPNTEVFLGDGTLIEISEFINSHHEKETVYSTKERDKFTKTNVNIVSYNGKICESNTYRLWKTPAPKFLYKMRTKTGKDVKVSENHPFLTPDGWMAAKHLNPKDRIAIPKKIKVNGKKQKLSKKCTINEQLENIKVEDINFQETPKFSVQLQKQIVNDYISGDTTTIIGKRYSRHYSSVRYILLKNTIPIRWVKPPLNLPKETSPEFWEWMGYFLSEGHANETRGSSRYWFSNTDQIIMSDFLFLTDFLFNIKGKLRANKTDCYFDSNEFAEFMNQLGFNQKITSGNKFVPKLLFKCTDNEIASFLRAYFDGDGTVGKDGLHITTKSKRLAKDLIYLFQRLNITCFLNKKVLDLENVKPPNKRSYWVVSIYGDDVITFSQIIVPKIKNKLDKLKRFAERRLKSKRPSNWDTIPLNKNVFRSIREGLGFTQASTGKPSSVNSIENGHSLPTRHILNYFIELFDSARGEKFEEEVTYLKLLSSNDIAWDHITTIEKVPCNVSNFYDFSVSETNCFIGNGIILHNTHGHTVTTGALKNAFGGLIPKYRHHSHKVIHEILVDLLTIQKEIHPGLLAVMDGTVSGDGAGPRVMEPIATNLILASEDQVAIDAVSAKLMGFDPLKIDYIKMAHDQGLGVGDTDQIEILGLDQDEYQKTNFGFKTKRSLVIRWDQRIRRTTHRYRPLKPFHWFLFHTPVFRMFIAASSIYHDWFWYRFVGKKKIKKFLQTEWGKLYESYELGPEMKEYPKITNWDRY